MTDNHSSEMQNPESDLDVDRRNLLKAAGVGVAALSAMSILNIPFAGAQDMSKGADNFYKSDRVMREKVTFKTQYRLNVAGNLLLPNKLDRDCSIYAPSHTSAFQGFEIDTDPATRGLFAYQPIPPMHLIQVLSG